jgi:hypothetical protein
VNVKPQPPTPADALTHQLITYLSITGHHVNHCEAVEIAQIVAENMPATAMPVGEFRKMTIFEHLLERLMPSRKRRREQEVEAGIRELMQDPKAACVIDGRLVDPQLAHEFMKAAKEAAPGNEPTEKIDRSRP